VHSKLFRSLGDPDRSDARLIAAVGEQVQPASAAGRWRRADPPRSWRGKRPKGPAREGSTARTHPARICRLSGWLAPPLSTGLIVSVVKQQPAALAQRLRVLNKRPPGGQVGFAVGDRRSERRNCPARLQAHTPSHPGRWGRLRQFQGTASNTGMQGGRAMRSR